jgi:hypothetical protein
MTNAAAPKVHFLLAFIVHVFGQTEGPKLALLGYSNMVRRPGQDTNNSDGCEPFDSLWHPISVIANIEVLGTYLIFFHMQYSGGTNSVSGTSTDPAFIPELVNFCGLAFIEF